MSDDIMELRPPSKPGSSSASSQIQFIRPAQMSLFARVISYPPLGEVTCVKRYQKMLGFSDDDLVSIHPPTLSNTPHESLSSKETADACVWYPAALHGPPVVKHLLP